MNDTAASDQAGTQRPLIMVNPLDSSAGVCSDESCEFPPPVQTLPESPAR